jgi:hypothetical protein
MNLPRRPHNAVKILPERDTLASRGELLAATFGELGVHGIFRLHMVIGFADNKIPLKMTE